MMMMAAIMTVVVVTMVRMMMLMKLMLVVATVDIWRLQVFKKSVGDHGEITLSGFKSIVQSKNVSAYNHHNEKDY